MAVRVGRHVFGRALGHHLPAAVATFGAHVDDPVGGFYHVQVVLDDDDGVARIAQLVQHLEQQGDVGKVQAGGGFIQDVQRAPGIALGQFERQLHPLRFAARQRGGRLAQLQVGQAHVHQGLRERASSPWCNGAQE